MEQHGDRVRVEREAEDRWRVWPADETWLRPLAAGALHAEGGSALIKEHPQHEGVLLQGHASALHDSAARLRARLLQLADAPTGPLTAPDYATASLLRRAITTRPVCMAATRVTFTDEVECCEPEPLVAHRLGGLGFRCARPHAAQARLMVRPGHAARARDLELPPGVSLAPGFENVELGLRAKDCRDGSEGSEGSEGGLRCLAEVQLEAGSVHYDKHARFKGVGAVTYWPEVRFADPRPPADVVGRLQAAGLHVDDDGSVRSAQFPVRREFVESLAPECALAPPRCVRMDFEPISFSTKAEVVREACMRLVAELDAVVGQLDQPVATECSC
ncbi:MAG: hypothetical protein EBU31_15980, partial [Proteobacteria bacterium]|nr:hypothetical protein [Pseudomonadota bacterium]